jgi:predicted permease
MNFVGELRLALRRLRKQPGFTITTIVTLALAIGANTAIFSVIEAVLMHPSGVDAPQRLAVMRTRYSQLGLDFPDVSVPDYTDAVSLNRQVESAALENGVAYNIDRDGRMQHFDGAQVSWQWFNVFGAKPILGRTFTPEEDHPGANQVAVLSYGLWQSAFGGDRDVVGRTLMLNQSPYRVVGVMRSDFDWPRGIAIWTPLGLPPQAFASNNRFNESYTAVIRLRPHVGFAQLNAGLAAKAREENLNDKGFGGFGQRAGWGMVAMPLTEFAAGPLRQPLFVLFGVVVLVLLIAAANVAGLFLARTSNRIREFAIRTALGASSGSLVWQLLSETLLLAGVATVIGIALGPTFGTALLWMVPNSLAQGYTVSTSWGLLLFTAGVGLFTSLVCGVGPAFRMSHLQANLNLQGSGRTITASQERQRLRSLFVIGEVAMAFVLLTGAAMFIASLSQLQRVNPGFNPKGILAGTVYFAGINYKTDQTRQEAFVTAALNNLANQPGVEAAAATSALPFSNQNGAGSFHIDGRPETGNDPGPHSQLAMATADYLKVMQIPLLAGRWISSDDRAHTEPVVVIDQKLARKYWPGENPIGKRLKFINGGSLSTIIGVVGNVRVSSLEEDSGDGLRYYPAAQLPEGAVSFVLRTQGDPYVFTRALQRAIASADPTQTIFDISSLQSRVDASLGSRRLIVWLLSAFSGLALLLALIGIYGLISYVTVQRTNEFGIRMALGAQRGQVVAMVMKGALAWVVTGLAIGAIISSLVISTLEHSFAAFGVDVIPSFLIACTGLLAVGAVAGLLPAQRAASTDPATTLRNE